MTTARVQSRRIEAFARTGIVCRTPRRLILLTFAATCLLSQSASGQLKVDDQHTIRVHGEGTVPLSQRSTGMAPVTVATEDAKQIERFLSLDEAIQIALQNSEVIRVLSGTSAFSSQRTIYDVARTTTSIDEAVAAFDPVFTANSTWRKTETANAFGDTPLTRALVAGSQTGGYNFSMDLSQTNRLGGQARFGVSNQWSYSDVGTLSPLSNTGIELSYTQPLLNGGGRAVNEAPILIARYNLDRSYYQFKDSIQELIRSVVEGYWSLVEARTTLWAREIQVQQAQEAFDRANAQFRVELINIGEVAQRRVALANFKANLIFSRGALIQREAALRNALGLAPEDGTRLVPSTPPTRNRIAFDWPQLVDTAQQRRPDLIELQLILLADQQSLVQAENRARPTLNAVATQRWDGFTGRVRDPAAIDANATVRSSPNNTPSWTLGVTFSVPVSLRAGRARARSAELLLARDRANIQQGLHATEHTLATTIRNLDQSWEQYEAFQETRQAARTNLQLQQARLRSGQGIFLNVLQAITDWGNAVSSEATSLTQYNSGLARLERETGTILDTHGVTFTEERYATFGPLGRHGDPECYPRSMKPNGNSFRYETSDKPSEDAFNLEDFTRPQSSSPQKPATPKAPAIPPTPAR